MDGSNRGEQGRKEGMREDEREGGEGKVGK